MKRTSRVLAAVIAATALTFTGVHTADAKPAHAGSHAKAQKADKAAKAKSGKGAVAKDPATKLGRHVDRVQAQLDRAAGDKRLAKLDPAHAQTVRDNVAADKDALDALLAETDVNAARAALRTYRVANYRLSVNVLRQAVKAEAAATEAANAEAAALVESAVELALAVTATTPKPDVKLARAALSEALALLEPEESELEENEPEDELDESESEDGTGDAADVTEPVDTGEGDTTV